jgi:hypothetical protein
MGVVGMADPPRGKGTLVLSLTSNTVTRAAAILTEARLALVGLGWAVRRNFQMNPIARSLKQNSNASARQSGKQFVVVVSREPRMWDWVLEIRG